MRALRVRESLVWVLLLTLRGMMEPTSAGAVQAERVPNIVLICADDLGWGDVGFNGRREWSTPHLDALAAEGTVFRRFYTAAVICAPSRAALLTGKDTIHNGVTRNADDLAGSEVTIAEALKAQGYRTALFGKWHHGKPRHSAEYVHPMDQGFDEFFGYTDAIHAWEKFPRVLWDGRGRVEVSGYADDLFTDRAVDFLQRNRQRPFFLYLPYIAPHFHLEAPEDEVALHRGRLPEADPAQPVSATYAALVTRLDRNVGRVLAVLDELGLAGQTLVVFISDHGATFEQGNQGASALLDSNRPLRGQKRTLWEGGVRIPAVVRWPGRIPSARVSADVFRTTDLFPTILAAAGAATEPAWAVDGRNVLSAWCGQSAAPSRILFWEWRDGAEGSDQIAALDRDLKLVVNQGGKPELYDVVNDPGERRDLAAEQSDKVEQLLAALKAWLATEVQP
jgi:arylsulfatase A-like enzyme